MSSPARVNGAPSTKAAFLIPAPCHSPGLCLLLGAAGGQDTSIKDRAELLIKLFVSYSSWAGSTEVQFACGQIRISHPHVGEEGGMACRLQKGLRDGKSALGRAIHSLECTVRVLVTRTVVDAVRGADRLRLVSSWAQRVGMFLCQQGGMAAGPCGVHPRRGRETIAGLGQLTSIKPWNSLYLVHALPMAFSGQLQ